MELAIGLKQNLLDEICDLARRYGVKKVILFGSRARGDYSRASDIDLAVSGGEIDLFALDVEERTSTLLTYDVVNLDRNPSQELLTEIERDGVILYEEVS